jgi:glucan 1,3-beta-glucosidase
VSLGGWLLLEPGTAHKLFDAYGSEQEKKLECEWDLLKVLRQKGKLHALDEHRESFVTKDDFERMKKMGLNAVRIPFGYWIVLGRTARDPYHGPGLQYLDRAVRWAEETGLQVLLDLHGAPGGESGSAPCGRKQKAEWHWEHWRFNESLRALRIIARRYCSCPAVTGVAVCNEPSASVPSEVLCGFYRKALEAIRRAGMTADRVTVVLPVFQRSLPRFVEAWEQEANQRHTGICFEVHWYHCFENEWHGRTFAQHLRTVQERTQELRRYPVVVGEWSLALGRGAYHGRISKEDMRGIFAHAQLAAYREASHGWFFWNWSDHSGIDWDWQQAFEEGYMPTESQVVELPDLPHCEDDCSSDDPLEAMFDAAPSDPRVRLGDTIYLRAFNGRYLDVEGNLVQARYSDRGLWQQFVICPFDEASPTMDSSDCLCDGDVVCLLAHNDHYLGVVGKKVSAKWKVVDEPCAFVVRTPGEGEVRHRSRIFLQSRKNSRVLAPNESDPQAKEKLIARWKDFGSWQRLVIEKPLSTAVTPHRPRRRSSFPGLHMSPATARTPRRSSRMGLTTPSRRKSAASRRVSVTSEQPRRNSISRIESSAPAKVAVPDSPMLASPSPEPCSSFGMECAATTPGRRRCSSLDLDELSAVATPSRKRRLSTKTSDFPDAAWPRNLDRVLEESREVACH